MKKNRYIWQIATLLSGSIISQAILFVFMPLITRLYSPSEFGLYSLFFSITMAVGLISSLKYEQAIVLPKRDLDARALLFISLLILSVVVLISLIVIWIFYDWFYKIFDGKSYLIWLIPLSILILGLQQIFENYSNRVELYKNMSVSKVISSISTVTTQLSSRYIFGMNGLVLGKIFSDFLGIMYLLYTHMKKSTLHFEDISKRRLKFNLKKHDHFPKFQTGTTLINYLSQNLPIFLFPVLFSSEAVGYYALAFRMLMTPTTLMTNAVRNVYYQKASKMYAKKEKILGLFYKTTVGLIKIYAFPFLVVVLFGEEIFSFLFGAEWAKAGEIAQIMVIASLFAFINPPTTMTFNILNLQKMQLYIQIIQFILRVLAIYIGYYIFDSYIVAVVLYVLVAISINLYSFLLIRKKL